MDSLPWAVADADVILRGDVTSITTTQVGKVFLGKVTVNINESLKGRHADSVTFIAQTSYTHAWEKGERLFFLVTRKRYFQTFKASPAEAAAFDSVELVLRPTPTSSYTRMPIVLNDNARCYDLDYEPINGRERVLSAIRGEVRAAHKVRGTIELKITPTLTPQQLASGNYLQDPILLNVPIDDRLLPRARRSVSSQDPHDRWNAVHILSAFESDEHAALLRGMLKDEFLTDVHWPWRGFDMRMREDPFTEVFMTWTADPKLRTMTFGSGVGKWGGRFYPIRRDAWDVLNRWKRAPADAVIRQPVYPPRYFTWRTPAVAGVALVAVIGLFLWRGWRNRRDGRPLMLSGAPGICLVLLALVVFVWVRSYRRIDDVSFRGDAGPRWQVSGTRWEVASMAGKLRVLRFEQWPDPSPAALVSVAREPRAEVDWSLDWAIKQAPRPPSAATADGPEPVDVHFAGFEYRRGRFLARSWFNTSFTSWVMPWWPLAIAVAAPVGLRGMKVLRYRRRVRRGLCVGCGYDLRHSPGGCPECGMGRAPQTPSVG